LKRRLRHDLAALRRQVQNPQVLLRRLRRLLLDQQIVRQPEPGRGEQLGAVAVVRERAGFAHQPVDHVAVLDPVFATPAQPRQRLHQPLRVPHFDPLGVQPRLDQLADEPAGHGVGVVPDVDRAAFVHANAQPLTGLQASPRQRPQQRQLLSQPRPPSGVELLEQPAQKGRVLVPAAKVPAAPQQQRLLQSPLELAVALLAVAVLVSTSRLDRLPL
jgi:hypothetical protein